MDLMGYGELVRRWNEGEPLTHLASAYGASPASTQATLMALRRNGWCVVSR